MGFQLSYSGGRDHHINQVGFLESNGVLQVTFADKNFDDNILWRVQYAYVPRTLFSMLGESSGIRERGAASRKIASGPTVIRGFIFDFGPYLLRVMIITSRTLEW